MRHLVAPTLARYAGDTARRLRDAEKALLDPELPPEVVRQLSDTVRTHLKALQDIESYLPADVLLAACEAMPADQPDYRDLVAEIERRALAPGLQK